MTISRISQYRPGITNPLPSHAASDANTCSGAQSCHWSATCEFRRRAVTSLQKIRCSGLSRLLRKASQPKIKKSPEAISRGETLASNRERSAKLNGILFFKAACRLVLIFFILSHTFTTEHSKMGGGAIDLKMRTNTTVNPLDCHTTTDAPRSNATMMP